MEVPGINNGKIRVSDIDEFIEKALHTAIPLQGVLATSLTQIYHRTRKVAPNCAALMEFLNHITP